MFEKENRPNFPGMMQYVQHRNYELAGKTFQLIYDDGISYMLTFLDGETLLMGLYGESPTIQRFDCMKGDESTYFVHIELLNQKPRKAVSFILDLEQDLTTRVDALNSVEAEYPRWSVDIPTFGAIKIPGKKLSERRHEYTKDLVGSKICWNYWEKGGLVHIYREKTIRLHFTDELKETFAEEMRANGQTPPPPREGGLPPFLFDEPSFYIKIKKDMYLAAWSEGNSTHEDPATGGGDGLILINTHKVMDCGRFFGRNRDLSPLNQMISAYGSFDYNHYIEEDIPEPVQRRFNVAGEEITGKE
jgi:hypothetical protein